MTSVHNKSQSLAKIQESILLEYKRLCFGEQTAFNDVLEPIAYSPLPKFIPQSIAKKYKKCIILTSSSFFQMMTISIMEAIFSASEIMREIMIKKIRKNICEQSFLFGSGYIKGLLVKGLRLMIQKCNNIEKPVAIHLQKKQYLQSFCQFWKQIIQLQSEEQFQIINDRPELNYFQHISNYTGISFKIFWGGDGKFRQQNVTPLQSNQVNINCHLIIKNKVTFFHDSFKMLQNEEFYQQNPTQYVILISEQRKVRTNFKRLQSKEEVSYQNIEDLILLRARACQAKLKGMDLVKQFQNYLNQIKQT